MFKKPCANLKTSAPLRGSDRRKLKQRVVSEFSISNELGDVLVPEGIQTQKFSTHLDEPGLLYNSPEGDPLWFTLGKGSDALIPSVYTLWKAPELLPFLTTPAPVVPKLIGGADLMIPGVVQHSTDFAQDQLVAVSQYHRGEVLGYPIAVGRAAVSSDALKQADELDGKGKALYILHTWKDYLWDMGSNKKMDVPEPRPIVSPQSDVQDENNEEADSSAVPEPPSDEPSNTISLEGTSEDASPHASQSDASQQDQPTAATLPPEDVSSYLRDALLQAISTTIGSQPNTLFPISASNFWSNYVLPARPAQVAGPQGVIDASAIDIKHSTHKTVKAFLKACAKEGLLKLKEQKGDVVVTGVSPKHPAVINHKPYRTLQSVETKKEKAELRERQEKESEEKKKGEVQITELVKPFGNTIAWFVSAEKDTESLYTASDVRQIFTSYVQSKQLVNVNDQQYINVSDDDTLARAVSIKNQDTPDFMKRDDVLKRILNNMQSWYELRKEGDDPIRKKGEVTPLSIVHRMRQGRKAVTLITGFELFGLDADELAEELRKLCSSSTTVAPLQGKTSGQEVMVQGKQMKVVISYLISKGVPKRWIKSEDLLESKKK